MKKNKVYLIGIGIFILYTIYFLFSNVFDIEQAYRGFSIFVYIQVLYVFFSWKKLTSSYFDAYILFSIAIYVFSLGQVFLDIFNAVSPRFSLIETWNISPDLYYYSEYLILFFLLCMHLGAIYSYYPKRNLRKISEKNLNIDIQSIRECGIIVLLLSFPFYVYDITQNIHTVLVAGYMGLYDTGNLVYGSDSYYRVLADFFEPALVCLLVASEASKNKRAVFYFITFLLACLPSLIMGRRTNAVILLGIMFLIYSSFNRIRFKQIVILCTIVCCSLFTLFLVRNIRQYSTSTDIESVIEETRGMEESIAASIISEMGWSMYTVAKTIEIKEDPNESLLYGTSFLWSVTTIVPNLFWEKHPAKVHADLSAWLTEKVNLSYGTGYSIIAESYANFGFFGFVFMFFLGIILVRLFQSTIPKYCSCNLISYTISIIVLWFIIRIVRNNFLDTIRYVVYYIIPIYLLMKYFRGKYYHKLCFNNR